MAEPYRILYVIESLGCGGAEKRLISDLKYIDRSRFSCSVCYLYPDQALKAELDQLGIPVYNLGLQNVYEARKALGGLHALIQKQRIHLIHTQLFGADLYGRLAGRFARRRVITTIQSTLYDRTLTSFFSLKRKIADRFTARFFCDRFIAVSRYVKKILEEELGIHSSRISVIHNSVEAAAFAQPPANGREAFLEELKLKGKWPILLHVGRLIPEKGHRYLFSAMQAVLGTFPNASLLLAGDGPERESLEALNASLGLEENVLFLGNRSDIRELLHFSDLFLLPSLREGLPVALLEAMAAGKPCIASKIGSIEEVIEEDHTGMLVPPRDSIRLGEAICSLLKSPEASRQMGRNAIQLVRGKFDAEANVRKLEALYMEELAHAV